MGLHQSKCVKNTHPKAPALTKGAQRGVSENKNPVQRSAGGQIKYTFFQTFLLLFINNNRCSSWFWVFFSPKYTAMPVWQGFERWDFSSRTQLWNLCRSTAGLLPSAGFDTIHIPAQRARELGERGKSSKD